MTVSTDLTRCLEQAPQVELGALFGSRARGDARTGSDVDLAVLLSGDDAEARAQLEAELGRAAGQAVDVVFLDSAPPLLRFEVARDGILLYERRQGGWRDFRARAMIDWWDWGPTARRIWAASRERLLRGSAP